MGDREFSADDLPRLRCGAHEFARRHAARAWEHQYHGDRWEITLPPDVAALPAHQRFRVHARHEARRLAGAQLYDLDPQLTGQALCLGAAIRLGRHEQAVALAGHSGVAATLGIGPPAASGFVRWRDGIGYWARRSWPATGARPPAAGGGWRGGPTATPWPPPCRPQRLGSTSALVP